MSLYYMYVLLISIFFWGGGGIPYVDFQKDEFSLTLWRMNGKSGWGLSPPPVFVINQQTP